MGNLIEQRSLGYSVYGQEQYDYTVKGTWGYAFGYAICQASLCRAVALDKTLAAYSAIVKLRQTKLEELGEALAIVSSIGSQFEKKAGVDEKITDSRISTAYSACVKYGVDTHGMTSTTITKGQVQQVSTSIQYSIDSENTELQQDMAQIQSYISKRDSAYDLSNSLLKTANNTLSTNIRNM